MSSRISQRIRSRRNQCSRGNGLLDDPAVHAQARAMLRATPGYHAGDALAADLPAVLVMVIAPAGIDRLRPAPPAAHRRDRRDQRHQLGDVVAVAAGRDTASGIPCPSVITWCFEPGLARSTGLGPVLGCPSPPARASCQSPPWTSPAPRPRSARPAAAHEAAATPRHHASPAAAASTSSPTRTPAPAAGTPMGSPYTVRTRCRM